MIINWTKDTWMEERCEYSYKDNSNPDKIIHAYVILEEDYHEGLRWLWEVKIYTPPTPSGFQVSAMGKKMNLEVGHGYTPYWEEQKALSLAQKYIEEH